MEIFVKVLKFLLLINKVLYIKYQEKPIKTVAIMFSFAMSATGITILALILHSEITQTEIQIIDSPNQQIQHENSSQK